MLEILCLVEDLIKYFEENIIILAVHINAENIGPFFSTLTNNSAARHFPIYFSLPAQGT